MGADTLTLRALGFGLVALAHLGYAAYLLVSRRLGPDGRGVAAAYLWALGLTAGWGVASLVDLQAGTFPSWYAVNQLDQARYAAWCLFLLLLLRPPQAEGATRFVTQPPMLLVLLLAVGSVALNLWHAASPEGTLFPSRLLSALQLAWAVVCLLLVEQLFRNQADQTRWGAKPLCLALGALSVYDVYLFSQAMMFAQADADALGARAIVQAVTVPLLALASQRQAGWLGKIQVSRTAAFYSATLLLIGLYLLFIAGVGYYIRFFGGSWGGTLQVALLAASIVGLLVLVLSGSARARLRVFLGKNFFSYRYDYRHEWLRFTTMLSTKSSPQDVGELVVRGLADMVEAQGGSLWFKALGDEDYVPSAHWNMPACAEHERPGSPFCSFMREREWIVDLGSPGDSAPGAPPAPAPPPWLAAMANTWLVVPLMVADEMLGFVVLARPRTPVELNWEVRDLLKTAARQAAGFLAQMHATEALLEARKFDAFNRMSAFVVHDLKNIITQLSLMLKNAERHRHNPEFQQDMLLTVESSLEKMRQMMLQLREGSKPAGVVSGVELTPVLQRIETMARQRGRTVELDLVDRVATRGHEQRLERVIGHLVQNALDATPPGGRVWVTLRQSAGRAMLLVGDTGAGMTQEFVQTRLFRPFSSTKSSGMGIGTYESFQYVRELGGSIDVKSEVGRGTAITLLLPLFDLRTGTDLRPGDATA